MRLRPRLRDGAFAFVLLPPDVGLSELEALGVVATMRDESGLTVVLEVAAANARGLPVLFEAAWITLEADTDLGAVGITASFARVLAGAGIACNVIAGARHDHLFVPLARGAEAVALLRQE
ncbi:MAG: ACT domain-containing protein [Planctomycetes bacterium]|nr:ACT domain-containing protein [Planctomycetota bacterium]